MEILKLYAWDRSQRRLVALPQGGSDDGGEGGDGTGSGDGTGDGGDGTGDGSGDDDVKTVTQAQLSAMLAREKNQGREAASREVADQLGMSVDEAKEILDAAREREDAAKTEAQKAKDKAERERAEAEAEKTATATERHELRVERALLRAGVTPDAEGDDADKRMARIARMVTAEVGSDQDTITAEVNAIKEEFPALFTNDGEEDDGGGKKPPAGDPPGRPPKKKTGTDALARGAQRAAEFQTTRGVQFDPAKQGQPAAQ